MQGFNQVMTVILQEIISPAVWLIITFAFLYFLWGLIKFIWSGQNPEARASGQRHMLWGVIGIAIMMSVFGILHFLFGTITSIGGNRGINNQPVQEPNIIRNQQL